MRLHTKKLVFIFAASLQLLHAQASAPITFAGEIGSTMTVSAEAFAPMIKFIESTPAANVSPTTLASGITSASTSFTLTNATGVLPGMGLALGTCPGAGCVVALVKAAGCTANVCQVSYGTLGTTPATFASGSAVTVLQWGNGSSFACGFPAAQVRAIVSWGAATYNAPVNPVFATTTTATNNATIATSAATIGTIISGGATCVPNQ